MPPWAAPVLAGVPAILTALIAALLARQKDRKETDQTDRKLSWQEVQDVMDLKDHERDYWHAQAQESRAETEAARRALDGCEKERRRLWRIVEEKWTGLGDSQH